ncbi:MAG: hypothetical protein M1520_00835 [Candidatus Marsarchaeota archaeon]|jgi:hypothetical protein|nr:hypothetical protein [Candidatus Marsarchaeota archaeon]
MREELSKISLSRLFNILTDSMTRMVEGLKGLVKRNEIVDDSTVRELREHIKNRLAVGEERVDNQNILKLLDLFSENKEVIEFIKEESEEWLELVEAIEKHIESGDRTLSEKEQEEVRELKELTDKIKHTLRED